MIEFLTRFSGVVFFSVHDRRRRGRLEKPFGILPHFRPQLPGHRRMTKDCIPGHDYFIARDLDDVFLRAFLTDPSLLRSREKVLNLFGHHEVFNNSKRGSGYKHSASLYSPSTLTTSTARKPFTGLSTSTAPKPVISKSRSLLDAIWDWTIAPSLKRFHP